MKIKIDRHLKTTLLDVQFRKKINVLFRITLNVTISNNLYIYVTKENNLLIHRLDSMNKDLHVFKRDENVDTVNDITSEDKNISACKRRKYNDSHKNVITSTSSNVNDSFHKNKFFTHDS
jgi:recombinational DNA repair protein RecR